MANLLQVETQSKILDLPKEGFKLACGEFLPEVRIAYETYGTLNEAGDNAILICPTLTSDAHAAGYHDPNDPKTIGWWDPLIGPGKSVDTNRYFVICTNILGGCKGTTGPAETDPRTGKPYGVNFPKVTIKDAVRAQKILLDALEISKLKSVIGGSLGGMQALEWSIEFPDFMERCVCVASAANVLPQALAFDAIARQEIEQDPNWRAGNYLEDGTVPEQGLSRARQIGHVTYLSSDSMEHKFGREEREGYAQQTNSRFSTDFQVESYLHYQGRKFVERFDANSYLYISHMMDQFDLEKEHGSLKKAFSGSKCRYLIVGITSDWLFPPKQQLDIVEALISGRKNVSFFMIDSMYGHDAFLLEYEAINRGIGAFVNGGEPHSPPTEITRRDVVQTAAMLGKGEKHILDVGSGDGSFMLAMKKYHGLEGICLDLDFDMIVACMSKGLNAVQLDADSALKRIEKGAFDLVLLNQTIQQLDSALQTLKAILTIAPVGVITFPNFAYYRYRLKLLFQGRLPVSESLPHEWYNTPNIHLVTFKDFQSLCENHNIKIEELDFLTETAFGQFLINCGMQNAGAERVLARLSLPN